MLFGTFNAAEMFLYSSPDLCLNTILSQRSTDNSFDFMVSALTVNSGTLYRQVCAFPNHVQSISFIAGGLQSSCRNISRLISGNRKHLAKGVNTYVHAIFQFFIFNTFARISKKPFFALSLWGIVCRLMRRKNKFNPFWNKAVT